MRRTDRDRDILVTLATRLRFLALRQVASWWQSPSAAQSARRRLAQLEAEGMVVLSRVHAEPLLELRAPIVAWIPGHPAPDFRAVSNTLNSRWPVVAPAALMVYRASRTTNNRFGGPGRLAPLSADQITHDLHVSEVYVQLRRTDPATASAWIGEDVLGKAGYRMKDPDAIVRRPDGSDIAIEFGGRYDKQRVEEFHQDCERRNRPYELW